ncbi:hypothetical protein LPJ61_005994, partial [Coemansia biformis]
MDVYGAGTLPLWCLGWAQDVCTRGTVLGALAPAAAAIAAWRVLPRAVRRIEDAQHSAACPCGSDNRRWIGPLAVALLCAQALAQAGALWALLARRHGPTEALAAAALLLEWAAVAAAAACQLRAYLTSERRRHYGLFEHPVLAFVCVSLGVDLALAYSAFLRAPPLGAAIPHDDALLLARMAVNATIALLLLGAPDGPVAASGPAADPRLLAVDIAPHRPAPETGASILGNLLFCWASEAIAVGREHQLQPDDLFDPPHQHSQAAVWARFSGSAARGRSLGRRLAATFWPELAVQAVLNPAC